MPIVVRVVPQDQYKNRAKEGGQPRRRLRRSLRLPTAAAAAAPADAASRCRWPIS